MRFMDQRNVALRDRGDFEIDKIIEHQGDITKLKTLIFVSNGMVDFDTWESWSNLRETSHLYQYLIQNNMKQLIPKKKFRENYPTEFLQTDKPSKSTSVSQKPSCKSPQEAVSPDGGNPPEEEKNKKRLRINEHVVVVKYYKKPRTLRKYKKEKRFKIRYLFFTNIPRY